MSPLRGFVLFARYRWLAPPAKLCRPIRGYCWLRQEQNRDTCWPDPVVADDGRLRQTEPDLLVRLSQNVGYGIFTKSATS